MNAEAIDLWERALDGIRAAKALLSVSPDAAASRAYYAAFFAVSALFAREGRTFRKHRAVEATVHRDLVRPGKWKPELGKAYTRLVRLREIGDYGGGRHVEHDEAMEAVEDAQRLIEAIRNMHPSEFHRTTSDI